MRIALVTMLAIVLAGCGASAATPPTPTPPPTRIAIPGAKYKHYPPMVINRHHTYTATLVTSDGNFLIRLFPKYAPLTVNNFVFLARHHYYDHNLFHRILAGFVIQTGDPTGTGLGSPGYEFPDELHKYMNYNPGVVAMANTGTRNTNGSQFFIVVGPQGRTLPHSYTIFGQVIRGMNVVYKLANTPVTVNPGTGETSQPLVKVYLKTVLIHGSP